MKFDSSAATYDATFGESPVGRWFRFRLAERVMHRVEPKATVLDIGCGTGEDALWLAAQGLVVHGVDESGEMIEVARDKSSRFGSRATFECQSLEALSKTGRQFDVVISNFGALSCVPLPVWSEVVPRLLTPGGRALVVMMGRDPLPETVRRGPGATRRGATAGVRLGAETITVHYDSIETIRRALSRTALVDHVEALGCLVPGPGYAGFARRHPIALQFLAMGEAVVRSSPVFRGLGDHTLFEFRAR